MIDSANLGYLLPALLGGLGVACLAGPFGAVMVWRRLAYFGDTLSHSGLLGVTLALAYQIHVMLGVGMVAMVIALLLVVLQRRSSLASDTLLGLLSYTTLAVGLLALASFEHIRVDVLSFLYGDILAMSWQDVALIYVGGVVILAILAKLWISLLRITLHAELAQVEGVNLERVQAVYLVLLAILVAIAIKLVGVLLITALLIVPAAAARPLSRNPNQMACFASLLGMLSVIGGLTLSHLYDLPTGPAIVVVAAGWFVLIACCKKWVN